jgi:hypothetical protein
MRVKDGLPEGGLSPDALWKLGWALRDADVQWMSGPFALALEQRYYAHLLGVTAAALDHPDKHCWWHHLGDMVSTWDELWHLRDQESFRNLIAVPAELRKIYEDAWECWYATTASELPYKENEERFRDVAPQLFRAIRFLRERQRNSDRQLRACSYFNEIHELNIGIKKFFAGDESSNVEITRRPRYQNPMGNLTSTQSRRNKQLAGQLGKFFPLDGERPSPRDAYEAGWSARDAGVPWMSGLLALAVFDHEIEFYTVAANVLSTSSLLHRDKLLDEQVRCVERFVEWIKPLAAISCVIGPMSRWLWEMNDEIFSVCGNNLNAKVADLHKMLFSDASQGHLLRRMMEVPDAMATYLRKVSLSTFVPRDLDGIPTELSAVFDVLEYGTSRDERYRDKIRAELFWKLRSYARYVPPHSMEQEQ